MGNGRKLKEEEKLKIETKIGRQMPNNLESKNLEA